ncbi:MAG TPA: hypothetical protein VFQ44_21260 [Streptosporangiaceae bacterium]|nr:hypothetical protein [Streptosporangiaceae bacterium]
MASVNVFRKSSARASAMAERLGPGRNDYNTEFGPANAALLEIAVAVELGDAGRALRTAAALDASALSAERRARRYGSASPEHATETKVCATY